MRPVHRPLTGVRVVALEQYMSAPYCTLLLADAGAEVIKIERPGRGDPRRSIPPYATDRHGRRAAGSFIGYNRNKKSVVLDLRQEPGQRIYRELAEDVFSDPHIAARRMLVTVDDPVAGPRKYARTPLHLSSAPEIPTEPAPRLGEHTCPVLRDLLGYGEAEIERLRDQDVIGISEEEDGA